ncbi:unnamed protein product [Nyctereutes procyonoides]|uniref:(raccoon dog) hypothetical protein n=1 Tax=Nyctereutes procyonoides TaxID=34880 RepID=A0A811ZL99_NYCPR|nr:unnamed protein product [Nyctereutes procyonoides]
MVLGVLAPGALLLLPPLLPLPQVGRWRSARALRGGSALGAPWLGLTPVPTGGAGLLGRQLRPLGPVPAPGPLEQPVARGVSGDHDAAPARPGRPLTFLAPRLRSRQHCPLQTAPQADPCFLPSAPGWPVLWALSQSRTSLGTRGPWHHFPPPPSSPLQGAPVNTVIGLGTGLCRWPGTVCPGSEPKALVASPAESQDRLAPQAPLWPGRRSLAWRDILWFTFILPVVLSWVAGP